MGFILTNSTDSGLCIDASKTISHTHSGDILIVSAGSWDNNPTTVQSVTYNGVALTQAVQTLSNNRSASIWYLVNPSQGTNNLVLTMTSISTDFFAFKVYSFQGSLTTSPLNNTGSFAGTTTNASFSINSSFDNCLFVDAIATDYSTNTPTVPARDGYTVTWNSGIQESHATSYILKIGSTGAKTYEMPINSSRQCVYVGATFNCLEQGGAFLFNLL